MRGSAVRTSLSPGRSDTDKRRNNLFKVGGYQFVMQRIPSEPSVSDRGFSSSQFCNSMLIQTKAARL